ncbi:aconitate hydratase [Deltaproteobacteria bacterium]|nr:aconitate hydratase [Deltaproteobacteria bacterium]
MSELSMLEALYSQFPARHALARRRLGRGLTLTEKVLFAHLVEPETAPFHRGRSFLDLRPDRVAMQDATAQMALLQFSLAGRATTAVPTTVHCDHLIRARLGAAADMAVAHEENAEVFDFLRSTCQRYGIGFWQPGAGIIHQVVLENYAAPGTLIIGTDSHTPNAGGLGMLAVGVGGADAVDAMVGLPWEVLCPTVIGVKLTGKLSGWTAAKDVILKLAGLLTVKGGTNAVIEYFGPGTASLSCTGKATICNMGAELGATTSIFPYDARMSDYLRATARAELADRCDAIAGALRADPEVEASPRDYYDRVVEIDLTTLEPHLVGPHTPDLARPLSAMKAAIAAEDYPRNIKVALIGSCTNSSYEDLERAAHIARQAKARGLRAKVPLLVTPGSDQIFATIKRDGQLADLEAIGATVLANACGPCIGQWKRDDIQKGERNTIVTSFNRNFPARNDANLETLAFIGSPETVVAMALSGDLAFNPATDSLDAAGAAVRLEAPTGDDLPKRGFVRDFVGYIAPDPANSGVEVLIKAGSDRLERLTPFPAWSGVDPAGLVVLLKAKGKCTTDHISAAGPWLKYRGHLTNISGNLFSTAVSAFDGAVGKGRDVLAGEDGVPFPDLARRYKAAGQPWMVVGDENYGEGSSREHAAMEPRFMGCLVIVARSFARIHETNLKKQGVLPLTFANPADYDKVRVDDRVALDGVSAIPHGKSPALILHHADGSADHVATKTTCSPEQFAWFVAGSALNRIRGG